MANEEQKKPETETLPDKLKTAAEDITGESEPQKTIPAKTASFAEEVSQYCGRIYGQVKNAFSSSEETAKEEAVGAKDMVTKGWTEENKDAEGEVKEEEVKESTNTSTSEQTV